MCETIPNPGRIAMYTSGCPKNQNRCCHNSGEPPACGCKRSLITSPAGMKKLVPARSEEHTSELQSQSNLVCRLLLEKKKKRRLQLFSGAVWTEPLFHSYRRFPRLSATGIIKLSRLVCICLMTLSLHCLDLCAISPT